MLTLNGTTKITVQGNGTGMSVGGGTVMMSGKTTINVGHSGTGLNVTNGTVTMNGGLTIKASGMGTTGVSVGGGEGVWLTNVDISQFTTRITMTGNGALTLNGGSIRGKGNSGVGIDVTGGSGNVRVEGVEISKFATGIDMKAGESLTVEGGEIRGSGSGVGISVTRGNGNVTVDGVTISEFTTGIYMEGTGGTLKVSGGTRIEFTGSGTGVVMGAEVTSAELTGVTIVGKGSGGSEKGVWVKGGMVMMDRVGITMKDGGTGVEMGESVTKATLTGLTITGAERGIKMEGKGTFTVSGTTIQFTGNDQYGYGIKVGGSVAKATLTDVTITGSGGSGSKGVWVKGGEVKLTRVNVSNVGTGILMEEKVTSATLTGVEITRAERGIVMEGSGTLTMKDNTTIGFTKDYGIKVGKGVTEAELTGVEIKGQNKGVGIYAEGKNLTVKGTTKITGVKMGISMKGSGTLTVEEGTKIEFEGEHEYEYGIGVGKLVSKATLTGVTITGKGSGGSGVFMMGGEVTMERVNVSQVATGVYAMGGVLMVSGGEIKGVEDGITMTGYGVLMVKKEAKINFTGEHGVYVGKRVKSTSLIGVTITGNKSGTGIYAEGGEVTVIGGEIKEVERGITMMEGGVLIMKDNTRIKFMGTYGVYVGKKVTAKLTDVTITGSGRGGSGGNGVGVYAMGGSLTVSGGSITGVEEGIAMMEGTLTVEKGARINFTGKYGYGIYVGKGVMANLMGVTIEGKGSGNGNGYGVLMTGGRSLTVSGGSIKGVKAGIFAVGGGRLTVKDSTRIEFTGSDGYGVYVGKKVTAKLTDVTITGSGDGYGIEVMGGKALLEEVTIEGLGTSGTGLYMTEGTAWLKETHLRDVAKGMTITKGVTIMEKGSVEFTRDYGIDLTRGYAFLGGVNIKGKETGQEGIKVNEGMLDLYKTNVRDVYKGMTITKGDVVMVEGSVEFKGEHGIYFKQGRAALKGVTMTYKGDNRDAQDADVVSPNFIKVEDGVVLAEKLTMTGNGKDNIQGVKVANGGAVWLKNTTFSNVRSGMTVERGGVMRMEGGGITFTGGHGISVSGGQAILSGFSITRQGDTSKATATGTGVLVSNLGKVMMRRVDISQVGMGVGMSGGLLVMDKGSITFKGKHGINLIRGYALLNGVKIMGPSDKKSTGIELGYGQVLMKDTTFTNVDKAITVTEGDVKMEGGEITFTGDHGILLGQGGVALMGVTMRYKGNSTTADFIKITGEDTTNAVEAVDPKTKNTFTPKSAVVVAASLKIDGSGHGQALNVTNGGRVVLMNPTYTDVYTGMTITKGAVRMIEGSMEFTGGHGILLKQGHALLTNVTMTYKGHEQNTTFLKVEATKVVNSKNERVLNTADIRVTGIKIEGNGKGQGVYVTNGGRVMLQSALLSNVINGVSVANGEFWMKNGNIIFKGEHAVSLKTGNVVLKGVIMEYKGNNRGAKGTNTASPNFIKVDGGKVVAEKVTMTGNGKGNVQGVKVSNGGHVTLKQSHVPIQPTIHIIHNFIL
ncbi:hypothetical protein [Bartonella schoenbuchensis]|uniref:hypothetical protein n=1 Tax=Bartonella schoenbuchensis TaxID=165694 RepID=UPI00314530F0